jgi:endonuclease/exonuclease/phosphatase family metal-dependent hydrolase
MRIATFNVESFFERAKALNTDDWAKGRPALEAFSALNILLAHPVYSTADKTKILARLDELGLRTSDSGPFAVLRQNHGHLVTRHPDGTVEVTATGRADWIGWVELTKEPVNELAIRHTAMVLRDIAADVQAFVEVENRIALKAFVDSMLPVVGGTTFDHVMLIDGNDERGIDVAIASRNGHDLGLMRSHVDDTDTKGIIFSRDCPEYGVVSANGGELVVLVNHLKSKGYGGQAANNARRLRQAQRVADIYQALRADGQDKIVVLGDFNDTLDSQPLAPIAATDLKPAAGHANFDDGGRPGTFGNGTKAENFDHILLSPALYTHVTGGAIFRMGAWGGKNGTLWPHYPTMTCAVEAASDHCAVYVDLNLA